MIAPLAITLALAFWAPYTPIDPATGQHQPVCTNGVQIVWEGYWSQTIPTAWVTDEDMGRPDLCRFHAQGMIADEMVPYQCMIYAHELGHASLGLLDVPGAGGIMDGPNAIPGVCYPPSTTPPARQKVHGLHLKPDPAPSNRRHTKLHRRGPYRLQSVFRRRGPS